MLMYGVIRPWTFILFFKFILITLWAAPDAQLFENEDYFCYKVATQIAYVRSRALNFDFRQ